MRIGFARVFVSDLSKSLEFYTTALGMELDRTDEKSWAQFKSGENVSLAIEKCDNNCSLFGPKLVGRFVGVTLTVDNIAKVYERLKSKGVEFTGKPEKQSWGGILAHLKDLDGNILTLMQQAP